VEVVAFEAEKGRFLGAPQVSVFEEWGGRKNLAAKFRDGKAEGIPYSVYRIEAHLPGYSSDITYVGVYQPTVTIVLGLRFSQELPDTPPSLGGRVLGLTAPADKTFVKLIGVFEHISTESAVTSDGRFRLGGLVPGRFLLLVIGERGILASKSLSIPYVGPPLEVKIGDGLPSQ
jgi:hypothetical protein